MVNPYDLECEMDPVTHGLTGALIAEAGFRQKLGNRARIVLTMAAMFPDIDIVYRIGGLPEYLANHRGLTHSFTGVLASGVLIGAIFGRFDEERRYLPWIAACMVALFSHQILDVITSYGTILLFPFSHARFYFDWVFIIDFFLSGTLLLFLVLALVKKDAAVKRARWGLVCASIYIGFCALNHSLAVHQLEASVRENQIPYKSIDAVPQIGLPFRWSGIIDAGTHYYQVSFLNFKKPQPPFTIFTRTTGSFWENKARATELGVLFFWFARYPVVHESDTEDRHVVQFSDLRFYIRVNKLALRTPFVLEVTMDKAGNVIESDFLRTVPDFPQE